MKLNDNLFNRTIATPIIIRTLKQIRCIEIVAEFHDCPHILTNFRIGM